MSSKSKTLSKKASKKAAGGFTLEVLDHELLAMLKTKACRIPVSRDRNITLEILPLETLQIDPEYQRVLNTTFINKEMEEWDDSLAGVLEVVERPAKAGELPSRFVFDGMHRLYGHRMHNHTHAACRVHKGLTEREEAILFEKCNTKRRKVSPMDLHRAQTAAGLPEAVEINTMLGRYGYVVGHGKPSNGRIHWLRALKDTIKVYGVSVVDKAMGLAVQVSYEDLSINTLVALSDLVYRKVNVTAADIRKLTKAGGLLFLEGVIKRHCLRIGARVNPSVVMSHGEMVGRILFDYLNKHRHNVHKYEPPVAYRKGVSAE